mmetsp:Transcript_22127/g.37466  ORF Transcript_22127/g.37466 Transcript_22127/m.37466 type:complete len:620 (+) Transcript_22127:270-2129(+)
MNMISLRGGRVVIIRIASSFVMSPSALLLLLKNLISTLLVILSLTIVAIGLILDANIADMGGSLCECIVLLLSLTLLAANEGFQVGVVSIQHLSFSEIEKLGYHRAAKTHQLMFQERSRQLKKLFIGQSFMVVTCSFLIAQLTTFSSLSVHRVLALNSSSTSTVGDTMFYIFAQSGLPGVIVTVTFAQLLPSIFSKQYPLQFLNIIGVHSVIRAALLIENVGIVKIVYLIYEFFKVIFEVELSSLVNTTRTNGSGQSTVDTSNTERMLLTDPHNDNEDDSDLEYEQHGIDDVDEDKRDRPSAEPQHVGANEVHHRSLWQIVLASFVTFCSFCLTLFSVLFLGFGIYRGYGLYSQEIPTVVQYAMILFVLTIVFYCEGLKIAIVSTAHLDLVAIQAKGGNQRAVQVHRLLHPPHVVKSELCTNSSDNEDANSITASETHNHDSTVDVDHVKRFLLGRQQLVVPLGFLFAQLTHFSRFPADHLPSYLYYPLVTIGLPGILVLLQFAQLAPQLLAEEKNVPFLGMRGAYVLTKVALAVESLGITNFTWMMFAGLDSIMRSGKCGSAAEGCPDDAGDDQLISIELGNRQSGSYLAEGSGRKKKLNRLLKYQSNPVQDSDSISV